MSLLPDGHASHHPISIVDCATCSEGYSLRRGYVCSKCSGVEKKVAMGATAAAVVVGLLAGVCFLRHLARVVESDSTERLAAPQHFGRRQLAFVQVMVAKALSIEAVKIAVVVWQIIFQVRGPVFVRNIDLS